MDVNNMIDLVAFACALGCGLMAGVFLAFSNSIMRALASLPPAEGIAAMQTINRVILNPLFLSLFVGTALACLCAAIVSLLHWGAPGNLYMFAGSVLYVGGAFAVTMVFNVPRNNALATVSPSSSESATLWASYLSTWTAWNHVRTVAALAATAAFIVALRLRA